MNDLNRFDVSMRGHGVTAQVRSVYKDRHRELYMLASLTTRKLYDLSKYLAWLVPFSLVV
jgi:hypothetical protein